MKDHFAFEIQKVRFAMAVELGGKAYQSFYNGKDGVVVFIPDSMGSVRIVDNKGNRAVVLSNNIAYIGEYSENK